MINCKLDFEAFHALCKYTDCNEKGTPLHVAAMYDYLSSIEEIDVDDDILYTISERFRLTDFYDSFDKLKEHFHDILKTKGLENATKEREEEVLNALSESDMKEYFVIYHYVEDYPPYRDCYLVTY